MSGTGVAGHFAPPAVVETHISVLTFLGDRAYKLKKPVRFDFLDFSTRERRELACQREVQLNRRLSPDIYLGVLDVVDGSGRLRDHLVEMVRLPPERRLSTLVGNGDPGVADHVRAVARRLAAFHATAGRGAFVDEDARHAAVTAVWEQDLAELRLLDEGPTSLLDGALLADIAVRARVWLGGRAALFTERLGHGHAVDGHGDLQADDVFCLDDGPRILDCIEFSDRFRHVDVWDDVAFLLMDLERLGHPGVAEQLASAYREFSDDRAPHSLVDVFVARRALVRSKVNALRATQLVDGPERDAAIREARSLLALAHRHLAAAEVRLVLVGGLPGTGKSTVAQGLASAMGALVLGSDATRKERAGFPSTSSASAPFREGVYDPSTTRATYAALLERARVALVRGESVVLDATWVDEPRRREARALADETGARIVELRCACPAEVAAARMRSRAAGGTTESDADAGIAALLAEQADPWPEAQVLDTTLPASAGVERALSIVAPRGPPAAVTGGEEPAI